MQSVQPPPPCRCWAWHKDATPSDSQNGPDFETVYQSPASLDEIFQQRMESLVSSAKQGTEAFIFCCGSPRDLADIRPALLARISETLFRPEPDPFRVHACAFELYDSSQLNLFGSLQPVAPDADGGHPALAIFSRDSLARDPAPSQLWHFFPTHEALISAHIASPPTPGENPSHILHGFRIERAADPRVTVGAVVVGFLTVSPTFDCGSRFGRLRGLPDLTALLTEEQQTAAAPEGETASTTMPWHVWPLATILQEALSPRGAGAVGVLSIFGDVTPDRDRRTLEAFAGACAAHISHPVVPLGLESPVAFLERVRDLRELLRRRGVHASRLAEAQKAFEAECPAEGREAALGDFGPDGAFAKFRGALGRLRLAVERHGEAIADLLPALERHLGAMVLEPAQRAQIEAETKACAARLDELRALLAAWWPRVQAISTEIISSPPGTGPAAQGAAKPKKK
ncbi:hypothetical protein PAPYR_8252 [Paratrimastix pyriformis]|uniref:Uncharacterized protein n=1 Tax=Paratrimastix pyriformis TaxID=342808 RepID=A0ABQ8UEH4_9EUKA|nr:hypothetical protein PAPYR_8252 [Paratrimastix pyriformis]